MSDTPDLFENGSGADLNGCGAVAERAPQNLPLGISELRRTTPSAQMPAVAAHRRRTAHATMDADQRRSGALQTQQKLQAEIEQTYGELDIWESSVDRLITALTPYSLAVQEAEGRIRDALLERPNHCSDPIIKAAYDARMARCALAYPHRKALSEARRMVASLTKHVRDLNSTLEYQQRKASR